MGYAGHQFRSIGGNSFGHCKNLDYCAVRHPWRARAWANRSHRDGSNAMDANINNRRLVDETGLIPTPGGELAARIRIMAAAAAARLHGAELTRAELGC